MLTFLLNILLAEETIVPKDALSGLESAKPSGISERSLPELTAGIINAFLTILGVILLALVFYGGFIWMKARGDEKEVEKAKNILTNAIIGLVIVLAAYAISAFVVNAIVKATGAP